jgi:hypothetical protein
MRYTFLSVPQQDLARLWEEHTKHEFVTRDTESTLATMVDDAYVSHVPVMTGAQGKTALHIFNSRDFIPAMPPDTTLTPVSRTIVEDRLVDEMIFSFTHTQEIPWVLPGVPPTDRHVEVPWLSLCDSEKASSHMSISTGIRRPSSSKLGSWRTLRFQSSGPRSPAKCSTLSSITGLLPKRTDVDDSYLEDWLNVAADSITTAGTKTIAATESTDVVGFKV